MKNRKLIGLIAVAIVLTLPAAALAGVDVNISIPLFGLFAAGVYAAAPPVYVAPAPPVYYAPPVEGAVFYGGYWYRPYGGNWFISAQVGGPWTVIGVESVPYSVMSGPVLLNRAPETGYGRVGVGVGINPGYGYGRGWYGRGGYGRHRDE